MLGLLLLSGSLAFLRKFDILVAQRKKRLLNRRENRTLKKGVMESLQLI